MDNNKRKSIISQRLKHAREKKGMTQEELANTLGYIAKATLSNYEQSRYSVPPDVLEKVAYILDVSLDWLYGKDDIQKISINKIITKTKTPIPIVESPFIINTELHGHLIDYLNGYPSELIADFATYVNDINLKPYYNPNDLIFFKITSEPKNNDIVCVNYKNTVLIRQFLITDTNEILHSFNDSFSDIILTNEYKIIGVMVANLSFKNYK